MLANIKNKNPKPLSDLGLNLKKIFNLYLFSYQIVSVSHCKKRLWFKYSGITFKRYKPLKGSSNRHAF